MSTSTSKPDASRLAELEREHKLFMARVAAFARALDPQLWERTKNHAFVRAKLNRGDTQDECTS